MTRSKKRAVRTPISDRKSRYSLKPLDDGWDHRHSSAALAAPDAAGRCVPFIDPYGDTVLNRLQVPYLVAELMDHRRETKNDTLTEVLDSLITYLRRAEERQHLYVKFIGD
jgi:hypothetical protein